MPTTKLTRLGYADPDATLLYCDDPAARARKTTDCCFDWRSALQWGGALPATGAPQPTPTFVNLALDNSPVLDRNVAVTVAPLGGTGGTGDGRGLVTGGSNVSYVLAKAGAAPETVANPASEGFRDFYLDTWLVVRAARANQFEAGLIGQGLNANISYGLLIDADGNVQEMGTYRVLRPATVGALLHLGMHFAFDKIGRAHV